MQLLPKSIIGAQMFSVDGRQGVCISKQSWASVFPLIIVHAPVCPARWPDKLSELCGISFREASSPGWDQSPNHFLLPTISTPGEIPSPWKPFYLQSRGYRCLSSISSFLSKGLHPNSANPRLMQHAPQNQGRTGRCAHDHKSYSMLHVAWLPQF